MIEITKICVWHWT